MKKLLIYLSLLLLLANLTYAITNVSIVTFNTKRFAESVGSLQYEALAKIVKHLDADIYCFQELRGGNPDIIFNLRDQYFKNYSVFLVENYSGDGDTFHNQAIMSSYPIIEAQFYSNVYYHPILVKFTRELLFTLIDIPCADKLAVFAAHLKHGTDTTDKNQRELEAMVTRDIITNYCANFPSNQVVLCGDFNTDDNYSGYGDALTILTNSSANLRILTTKDPCSNSEITWIGSNIYFRRFDYQLPNTRLTVSTGLVFRTDTGCSLPEGFDESTSTNASDHFPVFQKYILSDNIASNHARILVTEIDVWRSASHADDEFVELFNAGYAPANLKGWQISDLDGSTEQIIAQNDAFIQPGDYAVISKGNPAFSGTNSADTGVLNLYVENNPDFTSTDDQLLLLKDGQPVDGVVWNNGGTIAAGNASDFNYMARFMWKYPLIKNDDATNEYNARTVHVTGNTLAAGEALARWKDDDNHYVDTNKKYDWYVTNVFTKGADNFIISLSNHQANILLTEVYLTDNNPANRFIEIYNSDCRAIDIGGFSLTNSTTESATFSFTNAWLFPNQFGVIFFTNKVTEFCATDKNTLIIACNNQPDDTADYLAIKDNHGRIISEFSYNIAPETGNSWNRKIDSITAEFENNDWDFGLPTPGAFPEIIPEPFATSFFLFFLLFFLKPNIRNFHL